MVETTLRQKHRLQQLLIKKAPPLWKKIVEAGAPTIKRGEYFRPLSKFSVYNKLPQKLVVATVKFPPKAICVEKSRCSKENAPGNIKPRCQKGDISGNQVGNFPNSVVKKPRALNFPPKIAKKGGKSCKRPHQNSRDPNPPFF